MGIKVLKVVTVRMDPAMHKALMSDAFVKHTSLNKLCLAKLGRPVPPYMLDEEGHLAAEWEEAVAPPDPGGYLVDEPYEQEGDLSATPAPSGGVHHTTSQAVPGTGWGGHTDLDLHSKGGR
jgi:hypothetical protein